VDDVEDELQFAWDEGRSCETPRSSNSHVLKIDLVSSDDEDKGEEAAIPPPTSKYANTVERRFSGSASSSRRLRPSISGGRASALSGGASCSSSGGSTSRHGAALQKRGCVVHPPRSTSRSSDELLDASPHHLWRELRDEKRKRLRAEATAKALEAENRIELRLLEKEADRLKLFVKENRRLAYKEAMLRKKEKEIQRLIAVQNVQNKRQHQKEKQQRQQPRTRPGPGAPPAGDDDTWITTRTSVQKRSGAAFTSFGLPHYAAMSTSSPSPSPRSSAYIRAMQERKRDQILQKLVVSAGAPATKKTPPSISLDLRSPSPVAGADVRRTRGSGNHSDSHDFHLINAGEDGREGGRRSNRGQEKLQDVEQDFVEVESLLRAKRLQYDDTHPDQLQHQETSNHLKNNEDEDSHSHSASASASNTLLKRYYPHVPSAGPSSSASTSSNGGSRTSSKAVGRQVMNAEVLSQEEPSKRVAASTATAVISSTTCYSPYAMRRNKMALENKAPSLLVRAPPAVADATSRARNGKSGPCGHAGRRHDEGQDCSGGKLFPLDRYLDEPLLLHTPVETPVTATVTSSFPTFDGRPSVSSTSRNREDSEGKKRTQSNCKKNLFKPSPRVEDTPASSQPRSRQSEAQRRRVDERGGSPDAYRFADSPIAKLSRIAKQFAAGRPRFFSVSSLDSQHPDSGAGGNGGNKKRRSTEKNHTCEGNRTSSARRGGRTKEKDSKPPLVVLDSELPFEPDEAPSSSTAVRTTSYASRRLNAEFIESLDASSAACGPLAAFRGGNAADSGSASGRISTASVRSSRNPFKRYGGSGAARGGHQGGAATRSVVDSAPGAGIENKRMSFSPTTKPKPDKGRREGCGGKGNANAYLLHMQKAMRNRLLQVVEN